MWYKSEFQHLCCIYAQMFNFFFYVSINKNLCKVDNFNCLYLNSLKVKSKNSSNVLKYFKIFVDIQNSVLSLVEQIKCHKTNGS